MTLLNENVYMNMGFSGGSDCKESACNAGDLGSIPGLGRSPGEENDNSLQQSYLENPVDRGAWWATAHGITESDMAEVTEQQQIGELRIELFYS